MSTPTLTDDDRADITDEARLLAILDDILAELRSLSDRIGALE